MGFLGNGNPADMMDFNAGSFGGGSEKLDLSGSPIDVSGATGAALPEMAGEVKGPNFLQRLGIDGKRRSVLDIIGRVADTVANVGGADPLYQAGLDGDRKRQQEQIANDWQEKFNTQKFTAGNDELANTQISRLGQTARGLSALYNQGGAPAALKAWPALAQQLGLDPAHTEEVGKRLQEDPEGTITALNAALTDPKAHGTDPREVQIMALLDKKDPTGQLSQQYLQRVAAGYTDLQQEGTNLNRDKFNYTRGKDTRDLQERQYEFDNPHTPAGKNGAGGAAPGAMGDALTLTAELRGLYDGLNKSGAMVNPNNPAAGNVNARLRNSGLGQLVEGAVGTEAQTQRDRIAAIQPALVQAIAKATGMTAKQLDSNADMKLALQQVTDPTRSYQANIQTINYIDRFIKSHQGQGGSTAAPAAPSGGRRTPRPGTPAPRSRSGGGGRAVSVSNW